MKNSSLQRPSFEWSEILKALADDTRLKIVNILLDEERSVNDLANVLGSKAYNISRHLKILETCGLVFARKEGNMKIYNIADNLRSRLDNNRVLDLGCCKFIFKD